MNNFAKQISVLNEEYDAKEVAQLELMAKAESDEYFKNYLDEFERALPKEFDAKIDTWKRTYFERGKWGSEDYLSITLYGISAMYFGRSGSFHYHLDGEIEYGHNGKVFTFGRRGIENGISISANSLRDLPRAPQLVKQIIADVKEQQDKMAGSVDVKIGRSTFTMTSQQLNNIRERLKSTGQATVNPQGMGIGYYLYTKMPPGRFGRGQCSPDTATLFGQDKLFYTEFDAD